ncbi:GNAT family N-acetyltransferase [Seongchinamella sediminis]|uniref:GNAT family N-acetyltransferase n=1 Tax=Seongchinamella sediminis TaxID=2283635 RepID=A0A3L7DTJ2_9GAMM|nr:GNAT family N-acetyltransferase [Seongchinamella sediminis]RLQ20888.1 GNAT family N-acetyltransferase [Seongchinamella sediminis]
MPVNAEFVTSLEQVDAAEWEALCGTDYPFLRHRFLLGLEQTGCTTAETGWQPCHLLLRDGETAVVALPLYLKPHSYGEYVFDWSWSQAWEQSGLQYYPRLVSAIPFTPATGPRLCHRAELSAGEAWQLAIQALEQFARARELSSWHLLFPEESVSAELLTRGIHQRRATQFHWFNEGYRDFDDFLAGFSSRKRKSLKRERRRVQEQNLELQTLVGDEISDEHWQKFYHFYQYTYAKRSGHGGYLTRAFFTRVAAGMGDQVIMVMASHAGSAVAAALYFRSADTLYGRYWGCEQEFDCLHFEACYYRGIEYCIEQGIGRFDPGAQGEHKIQRGFRPVTTFSNHWIADPGLSAAVADFTRRERPHTEAYRKEAETLLPFKQSR